jgi:hypothetical protein
MSCGSSMGDILVSPDGTSHIRRLFKCPNCQYIICNLCLVTDPGLINEVDKFLKTNNRDPLNTLSAFESAVKSHVTLAVKCPRCEKELDVYKDVL